MQRLRLTWWILLILLATSDLIAASENPIGHIAVWHHHRPAVKSVMLPPSMPGRVLADGLVQIASVPEGVVPNSDNCYCFDASDDRLAYVHTYYYAHNAISNYNALLRELRLPQLRDVIITLIKDPTAPTSASVVRKRHPNITLRYSSPAIDPFTIDREIGRLILGLLVPHFRQKITGSESVLSPRLQAEEDGIEDGTANILAALELGTAGSLAHTADTLDAPVVEDVDSFVRFPDLVTTRRQVVKELIDAPRFAARYPVHVAKLQKSLEDPVQAEGLNQLDENATSAILNQPLWHAAIRYGFRPTKILVLKALAGWSSPDYGYVASGRELVMQAQIMGQKWADFLSEEYQRRGLPVPDARIELRPNETPAR